MRLYCGRAAVALRIARGCFHLATTQQRAQPRKAGTPKSAKGSNARNAPTTAAKKAGAAKKAAAPSKAGATRKATVAKKASPRKAPASPRTGKSVASAGAARPAPRNRIKPARTPDASDRLRTLVRNALEDLKAKDIQEIDVRGKSSVTDLMVVVSGTSSRHVKSIADEVVKKAKQASLPPIGVEGQREGEWVLVDLGDVIVHVMLPRTREFYGLERLWTVGDDMPATLAG
jgi:ribosome silencing factor RsfS/YbeB/iojap